MSVWKSPVFYFGIFLVTALVMLLVAPFVVDWDSWRGNLEAYGHKITGRSVAINGPINVRLFPFPTLQMNDVAIANPPGFHGAAMAEVKRLTAHLSLGGLFSGEIRVEAIDVESPVLNLARNEQGEINWRFVPDEQLAQSHLLDKVRLDGIVVSAGRIHLDDDARAQEVVLDHLDGKLSAPSLSGPWRANFTGAWNDVPLDVTVNTAEWLGEGPLKFGFKVAPQDGVTPALVFDGEQDDGHLKGKVGLQPSPREDGRQGLEGKFKPLQAQATLDASFDAVDLQDIRITPADEKDTGTLIEGKVNFDLSDGMKATVALTSPHVDLDSLAGTQSLRVWRAGGVMALLNSALATFPEKLNVTSQFDVAALSAAGETLENVHLVASADQNDIRIKDFTADLPGRSRMKFGGIVFPGPTAAELGGTLAFESSDTRSFSQWLWPEGAQSLAKLWTGARGRLKAQSDVTWNGKQFGLQNLNYEFDGQPGKAELAVAVGVLPAIRLKLDAGAVDVESYIKGGVLSLAQGGIGGLLQNADGIEKRLQLSAKSLSLNGILAQNVIFDFDSSASGFEIKKLDIGAVGGARLSGEGLVLNGPDGPSGNIKLKLGAERLSAVLQLLGVLPRGPEPRFMVSLGQSQFDANFDVKPGATEPAVSYDINGTAGDFSVNATGNVKELAQWPKSRLGISATLKAADDAAFAKLLDAPQGPSGRSGLLTVTASGTSAEGFATSATGEVFGTKLSFDGMIDPEKGIAGVAGKLKAQADDALGLVQLTGLPVIPAAKTSLALEAVAKPGPDGASGATINLKLGASEINGAAGLDGAGFVSADLSGGNLRLVDFLGAGFLPWRGDYTSLDQSFSDGLILGRSGYIRYVPDILSPGLGPDIAKPSIDFSFAKDQRQFKLASADGSSSLLEFVLKPEGSNFNLDGKLVSGFDLSEILRRADGSVLGKGGASISASFNASARSPSGLLAGMMGTGTLKLQPFSLPQFSPEPFFASLADVKDASGLQSTLTLASSGPGTELDGGQVDFDIKQGNANFQTLSVNKDALSVGISINLDLSGDDLRVDLSAAKNDQPDLPGFKVTYQGPVGALSEKEDFKALSDKLGYGFIARDMAELDRVKQEQEKLNAEQAAQEQADQEKFAAYQAQRGELRLRLREMKVHAAQREINAARYKATVDAAIAAGQAINKVERRKYLRLLPQN
jgi:hypothetical protein